MNIAIFTNNYLPNPFGVSGSIESFRKEFEKQGHSVYVFAPRFKGYVDEAPGVFRYPSLDISLKGVRFPIAIPFSFRMNKVLRDLEIDVIHAQHPNLLGWEAKRWAKKKNVPLVFTWHTLYDKYAHFAPLIPTNLAAWWSIGNAVRFANRASAIVTPTESVGKIIRSWGVSNKNIKAISTGVEEAIFANPNRGVVRKKMGINERDTVLLLVSRLTEEKNVFFVLESLAELLKKQDRVKLIISGGGDLVEDLKDYALKNGIEKKVFFEGLRQRSELKNTYAAGDIFVYASKSETQGMVITEAMFCGLPIVAVDATGVCDLVENGQTGFLVQEKLGDFAAAVENLLQNKELRMEFGKRAKEIAKEKYTAFACAQKMLQLYSSLFEEEQKEKN